MNFEKGKLLITPYKGKMLVALIKDNRLLYAAASEAENISSEKEGKQEQTGNNGGSILGNVYVGKVTNVVKNIDAAFVDIGGGEVCFLPLKECANALLVNREYDGRIVAGDEVVVQVVKEAVKTKQPSLSANISFTGAYVVLTIGKKKIGYSGKLTIEEKERLKNFVSEQRERFAAGKYGFVFRTNCKELTEDFGKLEEELEDLSAQADSFLEMAGHRTCYSLLRKAPPAWLSATEAVYRQEYEEIVTDNEEVFRILKEENTFQKVAVRLYEDRTLKLSKLYSLETKMTEALAKNVWLKSGGYLVIEPTEALTVIDVNTGKSIGKKAAKEHFYKINIEAAEEIALQLKLRNISGIIIVDFINMDTKEYEDNLLAELKRHLGKDSVKTSVIDITPLGLVEITRQKKSRPLAEQLGE